MTTVAPTSYETSILASDDVAQGTMAFYLARPAGFEFKAGQSLDLTLVDPPETDAEGATRTFTIASPPFEPELMIATRMRDTAFKRVLARGPDAVRLRIEGPSGSFTLHHDAEKPAVFLAGGIGITPFHSIIFQANHEKAAHDLYLFYANRRPEDAAFLEPLCEIAASNKKVHLALTMSEMAQSHRPWDGEVGTITEEMLSRHLRSLKGPIYYVAGPPGMVTAMRKMLVSAGVDEDHVRTEEFAGY
jgi:ferredoxin-NADP reductase